MALVSLIGSLDRLSVALQNAQREGITLSDAKAGAAIHDFKEQRKAYHKKYAVQALSQVNADLSELRQIDDYDDRNKPITEQIRDAVSSFQIGDPEKVYQSIAKIKDLSESLREPPAAQRIDKIKNLPSEVADEINADIEEMERCFNAKCYRSVVILCGRVLEAALHRKYFETTQHDILEKNPGIGLGNLIAKLADKNVHFDPGLTQQIHLINQMRIFSVHKKKTVFNPSQAQAQAMVLYTTDVLSKMFK